MTKAARATAAGATRTTVVMVARMTPNGDEDNEDGNSKKNDKATMKPPTTTEDEGECRQSLKDNRGRGHHRPRDAAIAPTSYVHSGVCVGNSLPRHDPDSQPKKGQLNRMSPTCRANIHNMSATDVCRLGGVADRHKSRHCQPSYCRHPNKIKCPGNNANPEKNCGECRGEQGRITRC